MGAFAFPESMKSHKLLQTGCFFKLIRVPKAALYIKSREALLSSFSSFFRKLPSYGSPNRIITSTLASKANFVVINRGESGVDNFPNRSDSNPNFEDMEKNF